MGCVPPAAISPLERCPSLPAWNDHSEGPGGASRGPRPVLAAGQSCSVSKGGKKAAHLGQHSCSHLETDRALVDPGAPPGLMCNLGAIRGGKANTRTSQPLGLWRLWFLAFGPSRRSFSLVPNYYFPFLHYPPSLFSPSTPTPDPALSCSSVRQSPGWLPLPQKQQPHFLRGEGGRNGGLDPTPR